MSEQKKRVVALGFFDGVHLGHRAIITQTVRLAQKLNMRPAALSFSTVPKRTRGDALPSLLTSMALRQALLQALGILDVLALDFDEQMRAMPPQRFVLEILIGRFFAGGLVCGPSFRFGKGAVGDIALLDALCAQNGVRLAVCPEVKDGPDVVSSTLIRALLASGDIQRANRLLGRPYTLSGVFLDGLFVPDPALAALKPGRYEVEAGGQKMQALALESNNIRLLGPVRRVDTIKFLTLQDG